MLNIDAGGRCAPQVLVVDDSSLMRLVLSKMLSRRGYAVIEDDRAENALARLRETPFDLVILDVMSSGMSGFTLCQIIRHELDLIDLPVVAYTAHADLANVARMRLAGFNEFIFKPVCAAALDSVLQEVIVRH